METLDHYYEILGVKPFSSLLEINQAYVRAINALHPSRTSTNPEVQMKAEARAKGINEAYEKIKKAYSPGKQAFGSIRKDSAPPHPVRRNPLPPATVNATPHKETAFKSAVAKAVADWEKAAAAAEEKALAEKAAAVVAATHTTAAAISAAVFAATDREAMARAAAVKAAADRDVAERAAAASAAAARAAAAKAAEKRAAAVARAVAILVKGLLLVSFCVLTVVVYTKAVKPVLTARKSAVRASVTRRYNKPLPVSRRDVKQFQPPSQSPVTYVAEEINSEKPSGTVVVPAIFTKPDPERAAHHAAVVRQAAEHGDVRAQRRLGYLYETGNGVNQDYAEAAAWYRRGAEGGDAEAQKNLAILYHEGRGVTKDLREAVKWYRRAANLGNAEAQSALEIWTFQ